MIGQHNRTPLANITVLVAATWLIPVINASTGYEFTARGRTYTVTTQSVGEAMQLSAGYSTYEASVLLPDAVTGNQYLLLLNTNLVAPDGKHGEGIFLYGSSTPTNFSLVGKLVDNTSVNNICDMIDARPIWDGTEWHVYVQARSGTYPTGSCESVNNVYEAYGPSLSPGALHWVTVPGNPGEAQEIITGLSGSAGIAETFQWYNPSQGIPGWNFMNTYFDWTQGPSVESYLSQNDSTYYYWYGPDPAPAFPAAGGFTSGTVDPDAVLGGSLDASTLGDPGIGFSSVCNQYEPIFQYTVALGFFDNPTWDVTTAPRTSQAVPGDLDSVNWTDFGPASFRPRLARNEFGYVPSSNPGGYPRTWTTYVYYTYTGIQDNAPCNTYNYYQTTTNAIGATQITITEQ